MSKPDKHRMKSRTHEDYPWPRVVPVHERPALPPLKTPTRDFRPTTHTNICKQDDYQDYDMQLDCCKPAKFDHEDHNDDDDDEVLMSRQKFQLLNEHLTCKPLGIDRTRLKSTYQIAYPPDQLNYDEIKNKLQVPKDKSAIEKCITIKKFYDPFPFTKFNDKPPLIA